MKMLRYILLPLFFICLCFSHSSGRLNKDELEAAVSAFDGFVDVKKSNKAHDKIMCETDNEDFESPVLQQSNVEEFIVKEKAHCTGCPYDLDTMAPDVIEAAKSALDSINDGKKYYYLKLVKASAQVEDRYVYNLKVEANVCFENETCSAVSCLLILKSSFGIHIQPELVYHSCV